LQVWIILPSSALARMGAQIGRLPNHGCSCAMPAVCCMRGEDGADLLQFETIKCKQATRDAPSDGNPMSLTLQVPAVASVGATTHAPQDQRHRPPALQISGCQSPAALLVTHPTLMHVSEDPTSPQASPRLRTPTHGHRIPLAAVPAIRSPVNRSPSMQQQQHHHHHQQLPTLPRRFQYSGSFCQTNSSPVPTNISPVTTPTARRQIRQPCQGPTSPHSPADVNHASPLAATSPSHRQRQQQEHGKEPGVTRELITRHQHEKAPSPRRTSSISSPPNPVPKPSAENNRMQPLTGSIDDSNTTAPPSPTVYYGTPNFTHRGLRCDDVQLQVGGNPVSRLNPSADLPTLGDGSSSSLALPDTAGMRRTSSEHKSKASSSTDINK